MSSAKNYATVPRESYETSPLIVNTARCDTASVEVQEPDYRKLALDELTGSDYDRNGCLVRTRLCIRNSCCGCFVSFFGFLIIVCMQIIGVILCGLSMLQLAPSTTLGMDVYLFVGLILNIVSTCVLSLFSTRIGLYLLGGCSSAIGIQSAVLQSIGLLVSIVLHATVGDTTPQMMMFNLTLYVSLAAMLHIVYVKKILTTILITFVF